MEDATRILIAQTADRVEDLSRETLMGLKFTLNERLETIQKLDKTILENTKGRDIENKSKIVVSLVQKFTVFGQELT